MKLDQIYANDESMRIDRYLAELQSDLSRSQLKDAFNQGAVLVNGKIAKASLLLKAGDSIHFDYERPLASGEQEAEDLPLDICYEDDDLLIINKVQGMVVHPAPGHYSGTLVNALLARQGEALSDLGGPLRPGIVHRIDKDTSGLILIVKNNRMHKAMAELIQAHKVERSYQCLVYGTPATSHGTIDAPLGRDPHNRQRMAVRADGKAAISHFSVLECLPQASHLEVHLETGRTHQIRVHCAYIGHPIIGDPVYAKGRKTYGLQGQALHAYRLQFIHPFSGEAIDVSCPLPDWFTACEERIRMGRD